MAAPVTDYNSLLAASADWLNRADLTAAIPSFVSLAEAQFNRELRLRDMMVRADCTSANELVELPDDWLEHFSLVVAPGPPPVPQGYTPQPLRYMSEKESNEYKAKYYGQTGPPEGYTVIGGSIELVLAPNADVDLKMVYFQRIPPLATATSGKNWLITKSPDLYLYSTLLQAEPYLKNDERLQTWGSVRGGIIEAMKLESERALRPTSGLVGRAKAF